MKNTALWVIAFLVSGLLHAQNGSIGGKVLDKKDGEALFNAAVSVNTQKGTYTDFDGFYSIQGLPPGEYSVTVQLIGYQKTTVSKVVVKPGQRTALDIAMSASTNELKEVTVTAEAVRNSVQAIQLTQKNSSVMLEGVSSEQIRRMPDNNSADILKRTSGTTIESGKYIIVRGLNDRYNLAMVNGALMPSSEPDRKVFSFDLYPTSMIENIYVYKTAQADLPAEFAGGLVQLETRNFPDKDYARVQFSTGANLGVTFNGVDFYEGYAADRWGMVADERQLPDEYLATVRDNRSDLSARSSDATDLSRSFINNWKPKEITALPFLDLNLSGGLKREKGKLSFGGNLALNYRSRTTGTDIESTDFGRPRTPAGQPDSETEFRELADRAEIVQTNNWGALLNLSVKYGSSQITLNNSFSVVSDNRYFESNGFEPNKEEQFIFNIRRHEFNYSANQLRVHQLLGKHKFNAGEKNTIEVDWGGSLARMDAFIPDLKRMRYFNNPAADPNNPDIYQWGIPQTVKLQDGGRFWSEMGEDNNNYFGNVKFTRSIWGRKQSIKTGAYYQTRDRLFDARVLGYIPTQQNQFNTDISRQPIDQIFDLNNVVHPTGVQLLDITRYEDRYIGESTNLAYYLMLDLDVTKWLRLTGGVRNEIFNQKLFARISPSGVSRNIDNDFDNLLPSLNFIGRIDEKQNLRASYSQAVSRPEFREIAPFDFFDFDFFLDVKGNTTLVQTDIQNFDLRYEYYLSRGQMFSLGAYYKIFDNPIEKALREAGDVTLITWVNSPQANNYGLEFTWRFDLALFGLPESYKNFVVFGNYSYIRSIIEQVDPNGTTYERPMIGQSPYIINVGLDYKFEKLKADIVLLYNQYGRRVVLTGIKELQLEPVWENPRPVIDVRYSQEINDKVSVNITLRDLINLPIVYYQDNNFDGKWNGDVWDDFIENNLTERPNADFDHMRTRFQPNREVTLGVTWKL